jgi:hypothetical protein
MYKWYEGKRPDIEQRRDAEITVLFLQGIEYFLSKQEIEKNNKSVTLYDEQPRRADEKELEGLVFR